MKIASADIRLASQRQYVEKREQSERLEMWVGTRGGAPNEGRLQRGPFAGADRLELSPQAASLRAPAEQALGEIDPDESLELDSDLKLLKMLMEKVLKKKVKLSDVAFKAPGGGETEFATPQRAAAPGQTRQGFGLAYDYSASHYESEQTDFAARGVVKTADGKEIAFSLDLSMQREYYREENLSIRLGDAALVDPLVLNFDGNAAELTDARFSFDLDADGDAEAVPFLSGNRAFLAFDRNGDGVINDGSELFGPTTGDGFAELAVYDQDGNAFIDEGDEIYDQLRLYNKNAAGEDQLSTLKEGNVGAIYLGAVDTEFAVKDAANESLGQVRQTGVFLEEEGGVGTVQQVDLAV